MELNIERKADMLKNSCKATRFNYDTHDCKSNVNTFYMKAGCPGQRAVRSRWQAFFSTSAFHKNIIDVELTK
jgi:hypothetical protein